MVTDELADKNRNSRTDSPREPGRSFSIVEKGLALVTAALVLASTVFGILFKRSSDARDSLDNTVASVQATNESLKRQINDLQAQNSTLTQELSALRTSAGAPLASSVGSSSLASSGSTVKQSQVALDVSDWADLARGITGNGAAPDELVTLSSGLGDKMYLTGPSSSTWFARVPANPTFDTCRSTLNSRREQNVHISPTPKDPEVGPGGWVCVQYGTAQIAALQVTQLTVTPKHVVLSYTLWRR